MHDDRANHTTRNNNGNIDAEQDFIRTICKDWYSMYYSFGKSFKSCVKKVDDIVRRRNNHQPSVTFMIPFFHERRKSHY